MAVPEKIKENQVFAIVLGRVISTLRAKHNLTQEQLAAKVGVSQPVLSRIESGTKGPDPYQFGLLAAAFNMTVQQLDAQVREAMQRAKNAAQAATHQTSEASSESVWGTAFVLAGLAGLVGLIGFAVAAVLSDSDSGSEESPAPTAPPKSVASSGAPATK